MLKTFSLTFMCVLISSACFFQAGCSDNAGRPPKRIVHQSGSRSGRESDRVSGIGWEGTGMSAHIQSKRKSIMEESRAELARVSSLMLSPPEHPRPLADTTPIVLATADCFTPASALVRNLLFSIARFTVQQHPVRFYILHTYDSTRLPHPQSILCRDPLRCGDLLRHLRENKHIDVRFVPVENNSFVFTFRPCASSKLWLARSLRHEPRVIYLDRDMVVKQDLYPLWSMFSWFPPTVVLAAAFETNHNFRVRSGHVSPFRSGIRDGHGPYWMPPYGVNGGMGLYDLQRMREMRVVEDLESIISLNMSLPLGDQDIINYYLTQQPFRFRALPCKWNQRADPKRDQDHCLSGSVTEGVLHGSRKLFQEAAAKSGTYRTSAHQTGHFFYDGYVNATKQLIVEFLENNMLLSNDTHWAV